MLLRDVDPPHPHIYPWMWCQDCPLGAELALAPLSLCLQCVVILSSSENEAAGLFLPLSFIVEALCLVGELCHGGLAAPLYRSFNPLGRYNLPPCSSNFLSLIKGTIVRALSRLGMIFFFFPVQTGKAKSIGKGRLKPKPCEMIVRRALRCSRRVQVSQLGGVIPQGLSRWDCPPTDSDLGRILEDQNTLEEWKGRMCFSSSKK